MQIILKIICIFLPLLLEVKLFERRCCVSIQSWIMLHRAITVLYLNLCMNVLLHWWKKISFTFYEVLLLHFPWGKEWQQICTFTRIYPFEPNVNTCVTRVDRPPLITHLLLAPDAIHHLSPCRSASVGKLRIGAAFLSVWVLPPSCAQTGLNHICSESHTCPPAAAGLWVWASSEEGWGYSEPGRLSPGKTRAFTLWLRTDWWRRRLNPSDEFRQKPVTLSSKRSDWSVYILSTHGWDAYWRPWWHYNGIILLLPFGTCHVGCYP